MTGKQYDESGYRRSVATIGWQVMAVCAALVVIGGAVILGFVFWQTTPWEANSPPRDDEIEVRLDPGELLLAVGLLATGAILCAGFAARIIARRAVEPLDEAFRLQQRFVADASHELRTPLAVLNARTQQLEAVMTDEGPHQAIIANLRQDARIMSEVVDDMLQAAAGEPAPEGSASLVKVFAELERDMGPAAKAAGVKLSFVPITANVAMPQSALRRSLVALIDNALTHSKPGATVTLSARPATATGDSHLSLEVSDEGDGIVGIEVDRVFDRFASGRAPDSAPGYAANGTRTNRGIGLALVKETCDRYAASIRVVKTGATGTTFELTLPRSYEGTHAATQRGRVS